MASQVSQESIVELHFLMDQVDGHAASKMFVQGKIITEQGGWQFVPPELEHERTRLYAAAVLVASDVIKFGHIDGIKFGTSCPRILRFTSLCARINICHAKGASHFHNPLL